MLHIPEKYMIVNGITPTTTNSATTCDYISMKNVIRAYIVVTLTQAAAHATGIDPVQATAVDGTGAKAFAKVLPIWSNEDVATIDTQVAQTAAVTYDVTADIKNKIVIFQIDAESLDVDNSFDCLGCLLDASSEATNFVSVNYILEMRYPGKSVITD